jgi:uncharacterized protein (TIGR03437 family)
MTKTKRETYSDGTRRYFGSPHGKALFASDNRWRIIHSARIVSVVLLAMNLFLLPSVLLSQVNVLTANYDNSRTNSNLRETILNPANVSTDQFGKVGSFPVDGQIYAQVLYASAVQIPGKGARNVVYVATMHNSVYAIDADMPASILPLWKANLGSPVPSSVLNFTDILPEVGILSTPVIDFGQQVIYVVAETLDNGIPVFRIHALSLADGREMLHGPVVITASVPGSGAGSENGTLAFDATMQLQRPGLALVNGSVFVAFGSHADGGSFHGWMLGYDASDLRRRVAVYNATPNSYGGSFWQAGRGLAIDDRGNILAVTGNGPFNGSSEFSDSVLKLSGSDLSLLDWYTPDNWEALGDDDEDLGSAGAILLPGTNQILAAGKSGDLLLVNADSMGHVGGMNSATVQSIPASTDGIFGFALWNRSDGPVLYVQSSWEPLRAFQITGGHIDATMLSETATGNPSLFSGVALSADSGRDGTAIVWLTTGEWGARGIPGSLRAFNATDLSKELWNSNLVPDRDTLGRYAKFVAPTVVNGRVYVPTFSNQLVVYGLLSGVDSTGDGDVQITSVANSASLLTDAISPGEVVTIFGANMGPEELNSFQPDFGGYAPKILADTQVLFDGVPSAILYTSSAEVGAVVPFESIGLTTQVQVVYRGKASAPLTVPVTQATPAIFSLDGTGGGPGAILNEDGSVNSYDKPAKAGSVIALFATGLGVIDPGGEDGQLNQGLTLQTPILPVNLLIDGQPAEILYVGGAPGMVQGVTQLNVRIPETVSPLYDATVMLQAGPFASPTTISMTVR